MKLTDLEPEMIIHRFRQPVGFKFRCPCNNCKGRGVWLPILFLNNPDGSKPVPPDPNEPADNGGNRWSRSGLTFDDLTLHPEVDASATGHWRGRIVDGEVVNY